MTERILMYVYGDITTDARVNRAADALAKDYDVTVLSTQSGKIVKDKMFNNILIDNKHTGVRGYLENVRKALNIIKKNKPDIFYAHDYYSALLVFLLQDRRYCKKIIYDAHELIIPEKGIKDYKMKFFHFFEKRIIKKVNLVICASEERSNIMQKYYRLTNKPSVIENISQLEIVENDFNRKILDHLADFFKDSSPTIVYAGAVTKGRRIIELFDAIGNLAPMFKLLIIGNGDALDNLKMKAKEYPNVHIAFTGAVPYTCLGLLLSKCDLGFIYYPTDTLNNINCASNKIYEYASVQLPMISNENVTVKKIIETNRIGLASNDFCKAIRQIAPKIIEYKKNCEIFNKQFPWAKTAEKLLLSVKSLV